MALGRIGPKAASAVPGLIGLLKDSDRDVRGAAALALARIGNPAAAAVPALLELASGEDKQNQVFARCALAILDSKPDTHVTVLAAALADKNIEVRSTAAYALGELGPKAKTAVTALKDALKDSDTGVRESAALALAEIGPDAKGAVPALAAALRDGDPGVRVAAATALGEIGPDAADAVGSLTDAVKDPKVEVREAAITRIGRNGPRRALGDSRPYAGIERRRCQCSTGGRLGFGPDRTKRWRQRIAPRLFGFLAELQAVLAGRSGKLAYRPLSGVVSVSPPAHPLQAAKAITKIISGMGNSGGVWQARVARLYRSSGGDRCQKSALYVGRLRPCLSPAYRSPPRACLRFPRQPHRPPTLKRGKTICSGSWMR